MEPAFCDDEVEEVDEDEEDGAVEEGAVVEEAVGDSFAPGEVVLAPDEPCLQAASGSATIIAATNLVIFTARVIRSMALSSETPDLAPNHRAQRNRYRNDAAPYRGPQSAIQLSDDPSDPTDRRLCFPASGRVCSLLPKAS